MTDKKNASLFIVATPIGHLGDMTQRARDVLQTVDIIAAEDTRHSRQLLRHFAITTPCISLHEHNEAQRTATLLQRLQQGESIALISDAGTPLISDPGYKLVSKVREQGIPVVPVPGCCAAIAALSASGLPADHFSFEGFLPHKAGARKQILSALCHVRHTMLFYESPRRLVGTLTDMMTAFGGQRRVCLARELTKLHETIVTRPLNELLPWVEGDPQQQKGECVLVVEGQSQQQVPQQAETERVLRILLKELPIKKAAAITASLLEMRKNEAYGIALKIQQK